MEEGVKEFKCKLCGQKFKTKNWASRHERKCKNRPKPKPRTRPRLSRNGHPGLIPVVPKFCYNCGHPYPQQMMVEVPR